MKITGIIVPSITVFHKDESINEKATASHIDWLIKNGVDGITPCGSSGENVSLTLDEVKLLIDIAINTAEGKVPVYPATGRYSTQHTIELSRYAEKAGASAVMIALPYYMQPPKQAIMDHFRHIRSAINIPIILYNNPWVCGVELHSQDILKLVDEDVIHAVKASHGDPFRINELKYLCGDRVQALYGHEYAPLEAFLAGKADGWLTGNLNIFPSLAKQLWQAARIDKNIKNAKHIWDQLMPYVYYSMYDKSERDPHFITIYKEALNLLGRNVGKPRSPLQPMTICQKNRLKAVLQPIIQAVSDRTIE